MVLCDRCGVQINKIYNERTTVNGVALAQGYDFCENCHKDFVNFFHEFCDCQTPVRWERAKRILP